MTYGLRFNPEGTTGNDVVVIPNVVSFNAGTTNWTIEFSVAFDAYPTTGNWYIIGSNTTTAAGFCLRQASGDGVLALIAGGTNQASASSPVGFILADGLQHKYRVVRVAGTSISFYRDDAPVLENKAWVTSSNFTLSLNRFGAGSTTATVVTPMVLAWFDATATVSANGQRWDSDLSGGTGNIWPTVSGSNQGNLVNFTTVDADKWINYGGVPEYTVNITGTYAGYTASVVADATEPVFTVSVAASYASYIAAVNSTNTKPVKTASITSTYPAYTATVSATGGNVTYNSSINAIYPQYTANVSVADVNKLSISTSYPAYTSNVISTNIKPIKTAGVVGTYAKYTASVVATKFLNEIAVTVNSTYPSYSVSSVLTNVDPIRSVSVNASYPKYGVTCTLTNVDPINSLNINSTYPKYSASVNAGTLIQDKTLSINSSYPTYIASVVIGDFVTLPNRGGKGAHLVISLGSRDVIIKDKSRNVKWRVENARL